MESTLPNDFWSPSAAALQEAVHLLLTDELPGEITLEHVSAALDMPTALLVSALRSKPAAAEKVAGLLTAFERGVNHQAAGIITTTQFFLLNGSAQVVSLPIQREIDAFFSQYLSSTL